VSQEGNRNLADIIVDTRWENEDPYNPSVYEAWINETDHRFRVGFYNQFGYLWLGFDEARLLML